MGKVLVRVAVLFSTAAWGECGVEVPKTGTMTLPAGTTVLTEPIVITADSHDLVILGAARGSLIKVSARFQGKALIQILGGARITIRNLKIDGSRTASGGILAERTQELSIENVRISQVAGTAVSVSAARKARILRVEATDSGGIRMGGGTQDFQIRQCKLTRVLGTAIQVGSEANSPRNADGWIEENEIRRVTRSAISVSDSTRIRVERNTATEIGYPREALVSENPGPPMAIETAGTVDESVYALNTFEDINGVCIGLSGFHHGEVRRNRCVNQKPFAEYPRGGAGIVMGESNAGASSEEVRILDNELEGIKQGGIVVTGRGHRIEKNRMRFLNQAGESTVESSGIYLRAASGDIVITDNLITGRGMKQRCIGYAPGVDPEKQTRDRNICLDAVWTKPGRAVRQ